MAENYETRTQIKSKQSLWTRCRTTDDEKRKHFTLCINCIRIVNTRENITERSPVYNAVVFTVEWEMLSQILQFTVHWWWCRWIWCCISRRWRNQNRVKNGKPPLKLFACLVCASKISCSAFFFHLLQLLRVVGEQCWWVFPGKNWLNDFRFTRLLRNN